MEMVSVKQEVIDLSECDHESPTPKRLKSTSSREDSNYYCDILTPETDLKSVRQVKQEMDLVDVIKEEEAEDAPTSDTQDCKSFHLTPAKQTTSALASELRLIRKEQQAPAYKAVANPNFRSHVVIDSSPPAAIKELPVKQNVPLTEKACALPSLASQLFEISSQKVSTSCSFCSYSTSCESKLKKHLATHKESNMELYSCLICSFTTIYKYQLKTHTDRHSMEIGRHFCSYCNFSTLSQVELEDHSAVHEVPSTHVCEYCGYTSTHKASFNKHIRKHGRPCPLCAYVSFDKADMEKHCESHLVDMVILEKREPVSEDEIKTAVQEEEDLDPELSISYSNDATDKTSHKRSRSFDDKTKSGPYACSMCQFSAASEAQLEQHFYKHTGKIQRSFDIRRVTDLTANPPDKDDFKCLVCPFHTPSESNFNKHCAIHPQGGALQCPYCERRSTTKGYLKAHIARIHKGMAS